MHFSTWRDCVHYIMQLAMNLVSPLFILPCISICATYHVERSAFMWTPCHHENMLPSYEQTKDVNDCERHASEYEVDNTHINSVHSWTLVLGKYVFHEQMQLSKDAQRKRIKYEIETPWEYEHRKHRDTQSKTGKHSHCTAEEQIILNRYT